jgi:drug/metabolite transporter (DMT)-like permease
LRQRDRIRPALERHDSKRVFFASGQAPVFAFEYHPSMKPRRVVAALLIVLGAVMLFAAPETRGGLFAIAAGVIIEIVGIALEKRR